MITSANPRSSHQANAPMNTARILAVDDDPHIRKVMQAGLGAEGWIVHEAQDRAGVFAALESEKIDLITLDLCLGKEDGLDIARDLRAKHDVPILMVTGRGQPFDRVAGLEHGADDYVSKPFHIREVVLRIKRLLAAHAPPRPQRQVVRFDQSIFDPNRGIVEGRGKATIPLTTHEQKLLLFFTQNANRVLSRDEIAHALNGRDWSPLDRSIDVHVAHLRRKLADVSDQQHIIRSVRGVGYVFAGEVSPAR